MAENTRSKAMSSEKMEELFAKFAATVEAKMESLAERLAHLETSRFSPSQTQPEMPSFPAAGPSAAPHRLKLDVPRFDGSDATGWIFKITQFFEYHTTPDHERLTIASFYMEGQALAWFQWMHRNGQLSSWPAFLHALHSRFASTSYEDPTGLLFKLQQRTTVSTYLSDFETLANRIIGLPAPMALSCFISGLLPSIRREVQVMQPATMSQAVAYARLHEEKQNDVRRTFRPNPGVSSNSRHQPAPTPPSVSPLLPTPTRPNSSTVPFKRLTPEELAMRREKGLCFQCDEKYSRGHKCSSSLFLLIVEDNDEVPEPPEPQLTLPDIVPEPPPAQLSFNALSGHVVPETLRLQGYIRGQPVSILIDGGSTHNFVHHRVVMSVGLSTEESVPLRVTVGNGEELQCQHTCSNVEVTIQQHSFFIDFHVLSICGADLVLGVRWLKTLGPVLTDYTNLTMKFMIAGHLVELRGEHEQTLESISTSQLRRMLHTNGTSMMFHIQLEPCQTSQPDTTPLPSDIEELISKYSKLFQPVKGLPPSRETDHAINIIPGASPVNVKPYRYPHYQKKEIEEQISLMLDKGFIRTSTSSFSSPVLLVKKKDGSWRFCVDYRALNAITIRDRFPIPTIDELLDELGEAQWFSKLDLMHGYHQILMKADDVYKTAFRTHQGHYEFRVMPFGLCNAPSTFQATMNQLFRPCLRRFIIVFFDDVLVYSKTMADHVKHLETAFKLLLSEQYSLKQSKCAFAQSQLEYLGHIVSGNGVEPVPEKLQAIREWPLPRSVKALRSTTKNILFYDAHSTSVIQ